MKKLIASSLVSLAAMAVPLAAQADVKVAFTGPLSGPAAVVGQDQYDGFMLAVEKLGGRLGGVAAQVLKEDDQLKPEVGVQLIRKLTEKDRVDAVVGLGYGNVMLAMAPEIAKTGTVAIATNSGMASVSGAGCKANIFSVAWQTDGPAESMGAYAQGQKFGKIFLMAPNYQAGKEMVAAFKKQFKGAIVEETYTSLAQTDYSAEISQVQSAKPDALFVFYPGGLGINVVKQMRQSGLLGKLPVLSVFTVEGTTLPALKEAAEGVVSSAMWDASLDNAQNREFVKDFQAKYKRVPSLYAAAGYDAANLLDIAVRKVGGKTSDKAAFAVAVKAAAGDLKSVRGPFSFNNNNMPVQNYYAFQATRSSSGVEMKHIATPLQAHKDAYAAACNLK